MWSKATAGKLSSVLGLVEITMADRGSVSRMHISPKNESAGSAAKLTS